MTAENTTPEAVPADSTSTEGVAVQGADIPNDQVILKLHAARVVASEKQPYLSSALFAMVPIRVNGLGTLASDAKWRLYYDPIKVMEWPVEILAGVLLHEVGHCIRGHADRFKAMNERSRYAKTFNIAGDALINEDLKDDRIQLPEGCVYVDVLNNEGVAATRDMSAEQIYQLIREKQEEACTCDQNQPQNQSGDQSDQNQSGEGDDSGENGENGDGSEDSENGEGSQDSQNGEGEGSEKSDSSNNGSGKQPCPVHDHDHSQGGQGHGDGEPCDCEGTINVGGWDCGSAADGIRRDYEAEGDKVDAGVDEDRGDLIRQQVAVEIQNHAKNRGHVPGGYERWAKELLNPVVDWRRELSSLIRRTFAQVAGLRDYTYQRPSRRQSAMRQSGQGVILPAMRQPNPPRVAIVIDTSGSMSDEMLTWALTETQGVLRSLGSAGRQVRVISCDAKAETQRVTSVSQITLKGGGGTDMRVGITEAMSQREKPDAVILITDGYTPYPDEPLKAATLIVALTDEGAADSVPHWARKVVVAQDQ